jgi:hypothetical protein
LEIPEINSKKSLSLRQSAPFVPDPLILVSARLSYIRRGRGGLGKRLVRTTQPRQETPVDFLTHHFSLLGLDLQWWMPIITGACAIYVTWLWLSGQFSR